MVFTTQHEVVKGNGGKAGPDSDLYSLRLESLGQSIEYRHLMLVQVDMVGSVYVDLRSVTLSKARALELLSKVLISQ